MNNVVLLSTSTSIKCWNKKTSWIQICLWPYEKSQIMYPHEGSAKNIWVLETLACVMLWVEREQWKSKPKDNLHRFQKTHLGLLKSENTFYICQLQIRPNLTYRLGLTMVCKNYEADWGKKTQSNHHPLQFQGIFPRGGLLVIFAAVLH